ncbi:pseudouridylate synthase RPUSD2-like [Glandiceps talaboti]
MRTSFFTFVSYGSKLPFRRRVDQLFSVRSKTTMSTTTSTKAQEQTESVHSADSIGTSSVSSDVAKGRRARKRRRRNRQDTQEGTSESSNSVPVAVPQKKTKFFNEDMYKETSYYMDNGLRKVYPYYYTFSTHCKGRWIGLKLHEVFKREFRSESPEYYKAAINCGMVTVNGAKASLDYVMKNNDFLRSRVHRHEPPVTGQPIDIVECNDDIVVINKPASIPVHPSGRYRHNTIVFLLGKVHGLKNLHTIHRLDRLTSGLLMFAKTLETSQKMDSLVRERQLQKTYISRVKGEFPSEPIDCSEPIQTMSHKIGVCRVSEDGKPCRTEFSRLSYNGTSSVVKCVPHTGRMHQIRVHLQYLGYPIVNDPLYNSPVWGPDTGKGGIIAKTDDEILTSLIEHHNRETQSTLLEDNTDEISNTVHQTNMKEAVSKETETVSDVKEPDDKTNCEKLEKNEQTKKFMVTENEMLASGDRTEKAGVTANREAGVKTNMEADVTANREASITGGTTSTDTNTSILEELNKESAPAETVEGSIPADDCGPANDIINAMCKECRLKHKDPLPHELVMYLHALSYKGPDFEYSTPMPEWAADDWKEPEEVV